MEEDEVGRKLGESLVLETREKGFLRKEVATILILLEGRFKEKNIHRS